MKRAILLEKLHNITFCASITALTSEECLEVEIITGDGVSYSWIGYDDWFIYELNGMDEDKWNMMLLKLLDGTLAKDDFEGTDFARLYEKQEENNAYDCCAFFEALKTFPNKLPKKIYCTYDVGEKPVFYINEETMARELKQTYSNIVNKWEDKSNQELEYWHDVYEGCSGIPCYSFDED